MNKYLMHYGILGMRWGVRRSDPTGGVSVNAGPKDLKMFRKKNVSEDAAKLKTIRSKAVKEMTNNELKEANARLLLERQYKALKRNELLSGQKFASEVLSSTGKELGKGWVKDTIVTSVAAVAGATSLHALTRGADITRKLSKARKWLGL